MIPQQSTRTFVPPSTGSVKKSVSVKEYMEESYVPVVDVKQTNEQVIEQVIEQTDTVLKEKKENIEETDSHISIIEEKESKTEITDKEFFLKNWKTAIDLNFQKQPTVYFTLKEYQPEMVDNTIYLTVKNELQKEEIEEKKRILIAYLRNNYKNEIEDIIILVNEEMESKIKLLDEREKLKLLHEQNSSLSDFMKILNLNLKE